MCLFLVYAAINISLNACLMRNWKQLFNCEPYRYVMTWYIINIFTCTDLIAIKIFTKQKPITTSLVYKILHISILLSQVTRVTHLRGHHSAKILLHIYTDTCLHSYILGFFLNASSDIFWQFIEGRNCILWTVQGYQKGKIKSKSKKNQKYTQTTL